ncbi:MAG: hypothetical protein RLZZ524_448 [Pseudomonadota bacterium]
MKTIVRSFAGGEVAPTLDGRTDLVQYQTGARLLKNFIVLPQGAAESRGGFEYAAEANHVAGVAGSQPVRLAPFVFAADEAVVLEFSSGRIRFYADGAVVLNTALGITGYTQANPAVFTRNAHGFSNGQDVFITGSGAPAAIRGRQCKIASATTNTFTLTGMDGTPIDGTGFPVFAFSMLVASVFEVSTPYGYEEVFGLSVTQSSDVVTVTSQTAGRPMKELRRSGPTSWTFTDAVFAPALTTPGAPTVTPTVVSVGSPVAHEYVVTGTDGLEESLASAATSASNDLTIVGNFNTVSWVSTGAPRYNVFKLRAGAYGFIGQTTGLSLIDNNILPDGTITPPEATISLNGVSGTESPRTACYYEQRRWMASTLDKPLTVFATKIGLDNNLTSSTPTRENDAFAVRLFSTQQNQIRHLVPLNDLWALTVGGAFRLYSESGAALSVTTINAKPRGTSGASPVQPVTTNDAIIYVQALGSRVREISYNRRDTESYTNDNLSIAAGHLFKNRRIVQLAYSSEPEQVVWAVRDDGVLLSLTLVPEQQVRGWARQVTAGAIESVAVIPEGGVDRVYVAVRRTIDGRTVRYIERMDTRSFATLPEAFCVDSGLRFTGAAETELSGLWHLEGQTVSVLADGGVQTPKVVVDGAIPLDEPVDERAAVGLQFMADLQTLPLSQLQIEADGQGRTGNVANVLVRVEQSSQVKAGPSFDELQQFDDRDAADLLDTPPPLVDGLLEGLITPAWRRDAGLCVRQDLPLPLTVSALILDVEYGG